MKPTRLLDLPKWLLIALTLSPLFLFLITMTTAIRIVQRRGNVIDFYGEEYQLRANIFQNDISAYGIDAPEHYIFACGFTLLSLALSVVMVLRFLLFRSYLIASGRRSGGCCCWNALVLGVGLLHAPAILLMAWSNGKQYDNTLHFFSAVIGLELLMSTQSSIFVSNCKS